MMKKKDRESLKGQTNEALRGELSTIAGKLKSLSLKRPDEKKNTREGKSLRVRSAFAQTILRQKELTHE